jgi:hypothetical protein
MDPAADLAAWLDRVTFADLSTDQVTLRLIDEVAAWAGGHGWRVYRRAPSVVPLPPPMDKQHSVLDVACARPDGPPLAIEIDHSDRRRTVDKLVAEAAAGRVPIWVRWGTGGFREPPAPVRMVPLEVTRRGRLNTRMPDRPPPAHGVRITVAEAVPIFQSEAEPIFPPEAEPKEDA